MRSKKESQTNASGSGGNATRPRLAVVEPEARAKESHLDSAKDASDEWDPYNVWRRHIRPDSDAA